MTAIYSIQEDTKMKKKTYALTVHSIKGMNRQFQKSTARL